MLHKAIYSWNFAIAKPVATLAKGSLKKYSFLLAISYK